MGLDVSYEGIFITSKRRNEKKWGADTVKSVARLSLKGGEEEGRVV